MQTLEQKRAKDAWKCAGEGIQSGEKDYVNLAKGLPALIMNSGLMQVMAFLEEKGGKEKQRHYRLLAEQMRRWLHIRFEPMDVDFEKFMEAMMNADSSFFQAVTTEAMAWLRWLRQMAAARYRGNDQ